MFSFFKKEDSKQNVSDIDGLNKSQRKAVEFDGDHLLVLAGAGTGKTKTIISRANYLIKTGVAPNRIVILTFTKKASNEIVSRINSDSDSRNVSVIGSTFHSWCNSMISRYPNLFGTNSYTVIDSSDQVSLMKLICGNKNLIFEKTKIRPQEFIDILSYARNTKKNLTDSIKHIVFDNNIDEAVQKTIDKIKPKVEEILKSYQKKKKERKYLDYDDIIVIVAQRLNNDDGALRRISSTLSHLLIDEMQDTNPLQWDLIYPLSKLIKIYCVGDDAQSIYSFRGADFKNINEFNERLPNSSIIKLEDNYRSTQEILDVSNWLLSKSTFKYNKILKSITGNGDIPKLLGFEDTWEESRWIIDKVLENHQNGLKYKDHLVLSRSMFYTTTLQAVCIENKVPFVVFGGRSFMESAHIRDILSVLRIINNLDDEIAWMRFLTMWDGIGEVTASKFVETIFESDDLKSCIALVKNIQNPNSHFLSKTLNDAFDKISSLDKCIESIVNNLNDQLKRNYSEDWDQKRKGDVPVLISLSKSFKSVQEFLNEIVINNNFGNLEMKDGEKEKDCLIISTIHSAKGLEADSCFVLNVSPGSYPSSYSISSIENIEEERRVLYVALTRAKRKLYITRNMNSTFVNNNFIDENYTESDLYFLHNIKKDLIDYQQIKASHTNYQDNDEANDFDESLGMDYN